MNYSHVNCKECFGIVSMFYGTTFYCETCGAQVALCSSDYDILMVNDKTGWIYPMLDKRIKHFKE